MKDICAGIVLYNPDIERLKLNIESIYIQVSSLFLIDNASNNIELVRNLISEYKNVELICNSDNKGIAVALNQMCQKAYDDGYQWILTLDQDSICQMDMIKKMYPYVFNENVGIICPCINYEGGKKTKTKKDRNIEYVYACMTSASLTNIKAWKEVGGFREDYFIDYVDNEFCMKLTLNKYKILRVNTCILNHQLGDFTVKKLFNIISISYSQHSPWRFYYMARNNKAFINEYKEHLPVIKEHLKLIYVLLMGWLVTQNKSETLHYIKLGLQDAKKNRMGNLI